MNNTDEKSLGKGKWLELNEIHYTDRHGKARTWESVSRRKSSGAVVMLAELLPSGKWILVRQYRPPAGCSVIEFPAGLIEAGECPESAAVRELREETGYRGEVVSVSGKAFSSPGLTSEYVIFVRMKVPEKDQGVLQTDFDESEDISCFTVHPDELEAFLEEQTRLGSAVDAKVLAFALAGKNGSGS